LFHQLQTTEALGGGQAGGGKTLILIHDPLEQILAEHCRCMFGDKRLAHRASELAAEMGLPENLVDFCAEHPLRWGQSVGWALYLRREFPRLEEAISRALRVYPMIDPEVRWDKQTHTLFFSTGYRYQFGHCRDPNDYLIYRGSQFTYIGYDELTEFEENQYHEINTRKRTSDPVLKHMMKIRAMSNPGLSPTGSDWVRRRFVDPCIEGRHVIEEKIKLKDGTEEISTRIFLPASLDDNPDPDFRRQYEATLRDKPEHIQAALLRGDWYYVAGAFFGDDWNPNTHICKPFKIPDDWPRFRSCDWGYKTDGCVHWWALDPDGNMYCEHEFTFRLMEARDVAIRIKEIETTRGLYLNGRSTITGPADTQLWEERGDSGRSKAEEMAAVGIAWMRADKKSRQRNAERLLGRLRDKRGVLPGIMFFTSCRMAIRTIPAIPSDENNSSEPAKGGADHWLDSAMYACAFASRDRIGIPKRRTEDDDEADEVKAQSRRKSRGRFGYGSDIL
jgi:hypothetical protein